MDEIDNAARTALHRAAALIDDGQGAEAIDTLRRVMETSGDRLIASGRSVGGFTRAIPVRSYCQILLASLHERDPAALEGYRRVVDRLARRRLDAALAAQDADRLSRLLDEFFLSSVGDDAAFWLGELLLRRGQTVAARAAWEKISPEFRWGPAAGPDLGPFAGYPVWLLAAEGNVGAGLPRRETAAVEAGLARGWLAYPDTDLGLAEVRARLAVVSLLTGNQERGAAEIRWLERQAAGATGTIAGRRGNLVKLLQDLREASRAWAPARQEPGWSTYGGAASRMKIVSSPLDVGGRPLWQAALARQSLSDVGERPQSLRVAEDADGLLGYFPLVTGNDLVLVQHTDSTDGITGLDLHTGRHRLGGSLPPSEQRGPSSARRFTLTAEGDRVYACLAADGAAATRLVGFDLRADLRLELDVRLTGSDWQGSWRFDGPPVARGSRLYVTVSRVSQVRNEMYVVCFDAIRGRRLWRQFVAAADVSTARQRTLPQNLLSLQEETLYLCTNLGLVAALETSSGRLKWALQYPRVDTLDPDPDRNDLHFLRDINPCLVAGERLVVAPRDCAHLFCLDAITGTLLWVTPAGQAADAMHLLGVSGGRLLASGECLYWFDMRSGRLVGRFPRAFPAAPGHARPRPRGYGKGLLAGTQVLWPTRRAIYVFDQRTIKTRNGWQPVLLRRMELAARGATGGNLLIADGVLLIAAADRLIAFNEVGSPIHDSSRRPPGRRAAQ